MSDTEHSASIYETPKDADKSKRSRVSRWLEAIDLASDEEKDWRKDAQEAADVYSSKIATLPGTAFNLYHANIRTLCPALYNSDPVPDIRRRYNDRDPAAKAGADAIERVLSYSVDTYDFTEMMNRTVFHYALQGRGVARVVYEAFIDEQTGQGSQEVRCRVVPWASFRRGPGRTWDDVPWVAFSHYMDRQQLKDLSPKYGGAIKLDMAIGKDGDSREADKADLPESDIFKRALVWEIWDKSNRSVLFIAPSFADDVIHEIDDPYGLKTFFPVPRPLASLTADDKLIPLCNYRIQQPLLKEIDTLTVRISRLIKQLRPRALGPDNIDVQAWASADDGQVVGIANIAAFLDSGGMEKLMAWFPMEPTMKAIQALYEQRERAKANLFEVSGLADIMRGQADPNETLGAQQIKTQWGSLRLQEDQQEVQRFVRDLYRLKAEIIAEKFSPENIAMMSGIKLNDEALRVITNEKMRDYRIDIETDSTIRGDLTRNMQAMTQFVGGSAQYFQAIAPVVQSGAVSMQAAVTIYSAFARNFKLGREVDAVLDSLIDEAKVKEEQAKDNPPPNPEMEKLKLEQQKVAMEVPLKQADVQLKGMDMEIKKMDLAAKQQQMAHADMTMQRNADQQAIDNDFKDRDLKLKDKGRDGGSKLQIGGVGEFEVEQIGKMFEQLGQLIAQSNQSTAQLIAENGRMTAMAIAQGNQQVLAALTAPKTITTPDGRTYTSHTGSMN